MTKTENDYFEIAHELLVNPKDFPASFPRMIVHKINYITHEAPKPNFKTYSYIVDWQLLVEDKLGVDKLWY